MGNMDNVTTVMNNWWNYTLVWVGIVVAVVIILVLVLVWAKLSSVSRTSKQSFKDLNNKIDSLNKTNEQKRATTDYIPST